MPRAAVSFPTLLFAALLAVNAGHAPLKSCAGQRTLAECFKLFDVIHKVTTNLKTVTRIAQEVVQDFAEDNVVYLELRTTPKVKSALAKQSFCQAL